MRWYFPIIVLVLLGVLIWTTITLTIRGSRQKQVPYFVAYEFGVKNGHSGNGNAQLLITGRVKDWATTENMREVIRTFPSFRKYEPNDVNIVILNWRRYE